MATPIKVIPTLHGSVARTFIERAEEHERNPRRTSVYSDSEKRSYIKMLKESGMLNDE